jgi:hypothetical protein
MYIIKVMRLFVHALTGVGIFLRNKVAETVPMST